MVSTQKIAADWLSKSNTRRFQAFPPCLKNFGEEEVFRPCLNFIRPSWNGWNGTRLFVVVRSIPTCFQVFVSIPTTKRKSWNSCELSAIGNILDCQYKTLGTIVTHRLQVGCLEHTHAPLPPLLFPFSRHDYSAARTHAVPWGGEGGSGPEARQQ